MRLVTSIAVALLFVTSKLSAQSPPQLQCDIQSSINSLPAAGGTVTVPANTTCPIVCYTNQINTGSKVVKIQGAGRTSVISGSGCTLITLASSGSTLEDVQVNDPSGNSSTIAVDVNNGSAGVNDWVLRNVYLTGTGKNGIGLHTLFGLKGQVIGGEISGFAMNYKPEAAGSGSSSNANHLTGVKLREGNYGIFIPPNSVDDVPIDGCTIEGNSVGIRVEAGNGKIVAHKTHFENIVGATPGTNIILYGQGSELVSEGNFFAGAAPNRDIVVNDAANAGNQISVGDTLNSGVTYNGSGEFMIVEPQFMPTITGTGTVTVHTVRGIFANNSNFNWTLSGVNVSYIRITLVDLSGSNTRISMASGKHLSITDHIGAEKASIDESGIVTAGGGSSNKAVCWKNGNTLGYCSGAVGADGSCVCQ